MALNRKQKLELIARRKQKAEDNKQSIDLTKFQNPKTLKAFSLLEQSIKELQVVLGEGVELNNLDDLVKELSNVNALADKVASLQEAIDNLVIPELPDHIEVKGLNDILPAIKQIKIATPSVSVTAPSSNKEIMNMAVAIKALAKAVADNKPSEPSQKPDDYIPVRRVIKVGNILQFDDIETQSTMSPGGGGGGMAGSYDVALTTLVDVASATVTYIGEAAPGSDLDDAVWRVKRITTTGDDVAIEWAFGAGFTVNWSGRVTHEYA